MHLKAITINIQYFAILDNNICSSGFLFHRNNKILNIYKFYEKLGRLSNVLGRHVCAKTPRLKQYWRPQEPTNDEKAMQKNSNWWKK